MLASQKRIIIYTILCIVVITILVVAIELFTYVNKPIIQGIVECKTYIASSKIAGRIDSILVAEGDWIERGDLVYTISTPELDNRPIKDLGKKWFGFTLMENTDAEELVERIQDSRNR